MIPEADLIEKEWVIRRLSLDPEVYTTRRAMLRWLVLSLGLANPNESRQILLDIFDILLKHPEGISVHGIYDSLKDKKSLSVKSIYYHLDRLASKDIVARKKGGVYQLNGGRDFAERICRTYLEEVSKTLDGIRDVVLRIMRE